MPKLEAFDLLIVAAYLAGMVLFGVRFSRKQKDLRSYFVGDRNVGWFLVLMSIVATETSAVTFLSVPGIAYKSGGNLTYLQLAFGYIAGRISVARWLLPLYMRGDLFSAYEVLKQKFGPSVQRVASMIFLLTRTIADGLRLYLTALLMQYLGLTMEAAIALTGLATIVYTYLGGMKAVLWTDLIQFAIKIAGAILAAVFILKLMPGGWSQFVEFGTEQNKFQLFDFSHVVDGKFPFNFVAGLFGGAVFSAASHGADQMMVQRYFCAKNLGHARAALMLSGIVVAVQFALFLLIGVGMAALVDSGAFELPEKANGGTWRPDEMFGLFIVSQLPVGVRGLLVAAVLAAAMSTLASSLNSSANALVTDYYKPLRPEKTEGHYVFVSRGFTVLCGLAQIGVAILALAISGEKTSVVEQVMKVAGMTTGLLLGLFVLGQAKRPVPSSAALGGLIAGFLAVFFVWLPEAFGPPIMAWPWFASLGLGTTWFVANFLSLIRPRVSDGPASTLGDRESAPGIGPAR